MRNIVVLEINGKKDILWNDELPTPKEFLLIPETTTAIVENNIFNDFIDETFMFVTEILQKSIKEKIDNVYITFMNNENIFICSVIIDKFNVKNGTYRLSIQDWQATGYTFKYADDCEEEIKEDTINEN